MTKWRENSDVKKMDAFTPPINESIVDFGISKGGLKFDFAVGKHVRIVELSAIGYNIGKRGSNREPQSDRALTFDKKKIYNAIYSF